MKTSDSVLIIDDELQIRRLLEITLGSAGFNVLQASGGKDGLVEAATQHPSLIILDLGLPDMEGISVLKKLREWFTKPVIVLSVRSSEDDIIEALDNGANDYLTKPFRSGELLARLRAAIRAGNKENNEPVLNIGNLSIDVLNHSVKKNNELLKLTSTEFTLLKLLAKNQGRVLTHHFLLKEVWGYSYIDNTQYLRVFIAQLRKKIEDNPSKPSLLITESGIGYRFSE
jgi:two-component system, OmpR family, KDP operon response regulator KdpE